MTTESAKSALTMSNNEVLTFCRNAVTASRHRMGDPKEAVVWSLTFWEEIQRWMSPENESIEPHTMLFVLTNVAHALADQIMRQENPRTPRKDSRELLLPVEE